MKTNSTVYRGRRLKELRENKNMSLRELAERTSKIYGESISHSSIKRYEEGTACDVDILSAICNVLDYSMIELLQECIEYDASHKNHKKK